MSAGFDQRRATAGSASGIAARFAGVSIDRRRDGVHEERRGGRRLGGERARDADAGLQPGIAAQSAHWDFLVAMASAGLGVALLPEPLMLRMKTRGLSTAKLAKSGLQWEVGHIWQQSGYLSYAARAWLEVCDAVLGGPRRARADKRAAQS